MKNTLFIAVALVSSSLCLLRADYWHGDYVDDSTMVFVREAALYSAPHLDSLVTGGLPMGTPVEVRGSSGEVTLEGGITTYWYQITALLQDGEQTGFVPGTSLAMTSLRLGQDTTFMFSVTGYDPSTMEFSSSARVVADGSVLDDVVFRPVDGGFGPAPYSYSVRSLPMDPGGLTGIREMVELSFIYEACGFPNRDMAFAWTGEELVMGPQANSQFEASAYRFIETFVTPSDSGGIPGGIRVLTTISEWNESTEDYDVTESYFTDYRWSGEEFLTGI